MPTAYRLLRPEPPPAGAPELDADQARVVAHPGGPLLVLAGPGTGKTTTIVEAVADRVSRRGADPATLLVLTFSRRAAAQLRQRITARLGRTTREPAAMTLHAYAYAVLRREAARGGEVPPRLLSGPEHLLELRRLLRGEAEDGAGCWPAPLRRVLTTRAFAEELRDLLLRARERGLDGPALAELGRRCDRPEWVAAGEFLGRYAARFELDPAGVAYDYAELIHRAVTLVADTPVDERPSAVFVDEYQDVDPAQERLLAALAGGGRDLVVVGDPDQAIYGFRGADVGVLHRFPDRFRTAAGEPAPVLALRVHRRSMSVLLTATRRLANRLPAPGLAGAGHRALVGARGGGTVEVRLVDSAAAEAALVADVLRRAHLLDRLPWSRMAVLVRSARRSVPALRRALNAAGVPVSVAGDEIPLAADPVIRPLLLALRAALDPAQLDEATAEELLTSPLGGADPLAVRRLQRSLGAAARAGGQPGADGLLAAALRDARELALVPPPLSAPAAAVARILAATTRAAAAGRDAEEVLWALWQASGLADRWEADSLAGGPAGAAADRALDAVLALFAAVARFTERLPHAGPELFLDDVAAQEIPADTATDAAPAAEAVRLLTAHRSKGLEWDLVVIAGVQEGVWPDLRLRGSVLGAQALVETLAGRDGADAASLASGLLADERRLFYVAATRARQRLVVTAVGGGDDDAERPSRFLAELADVAAPGAGVPPRPLALPALVADLRAALVDPARAGEHAAAAATLARLADAGVAGADPSEWYGLAPLSDEAPLLGAGDRLRVSPSEVEGLRACELRWFVERAVGGAADPGDAQGAGTVLHAVAALAAAGDGTVPDRESLQARLDELWAQVASGPGWWARRQRRDLARALESFLRWQAASGRRLLAVEQPFEVAAGRVTIAGRVDRLEVDGDGRTVVVDLKTGARYPRGEELHRHPQLGLYQLAVAAGGFAAVGAPPCPGGAELVNVGKAATAAGARVQHQAALSEDVDPAWVQRLLAEVLAALERGPLTARAGDGCRTCPAATCCPLQPDGAQVGA